MERKTKRFHEQTCPCGTVGANIGYVLGVLIRGKVVVKFGRKVFLVDRLLWKIFNKANKSITKRTIERVFMYTKTQSVTIEVNITATKYRKNDIIRSVLLLHIRTNLGMMLDRDYASCHAARSTLVMHVANNVYNLRWPAKKSGFKSHRPLVGPIETQGSCTAAETKSPAAHACYSPDMCGHSTTVYK